MSGALIWMEKGGEMLPVHPTCVSAHEQAGWAISEKQEVDPAPPPKSQKTKTTKQPIPEALNEHR